MRNQVIKNGIKINKLIHSKRTNWEERNFIVLEKADWILLMPILNILGCFELSA